MFLVACIVVCVAGQLAKGQDIVEVKTNYGRVTGRRELRATVTNQNAITSFKNIPYAKPPVGDLRFKPPAPPVAWPETRGVMDTKVFCPQPGISSKLPEVNVTEDCLLLDVYVSETPTENRQFALLPVIVYFHGGQFAYGSKDIYGAKYLLDERVVLVIANYRLGVLGFLSTGDREAPGNAGMRDQVMVLSWVKDNIQYFGGDPQKVTIFGHDSGAVSVSLHILSPLSVGLFSGAISSGGNAFVPWALTTDPREHADALANRLKCSTRSSSALVKCLRDKKVEDLVATSVSDRKIKYRPVIDQGHVEEPFLPDSPRHLYKSQTKSVPYICGITENEGSLQFYARIEEAKKRDTVDGLIAFYLAPNMVNKSNFDSVVKASKYHYLPGVNDVDLDISAEQLINMLSDAWIKRANDLILKLHSEIVQSTFMYVFSYQGVRSFGNLYKKDYIPASKYGVTHMDDVFYFFNTSLDERATGDRSSVYEKVVMRTMSNIVGTFATNGDVTSVQAWKKYDSEDQNYLNVNSFQTLLQSYRQADMDFWNIFVPDLQAVNNSTSEPVTRPEGDSRSTTYVLVAVIMVLIVLCVSLVAVVLISRSKATRLARLTTESSHEMTQEKL